jgi:hypothetical protein
LLFLSGKRALPLLCHFDPLCTGDFMSRRHFSVASIGAAFRRGPAPLVVLRASGEDARRTSTLASCYCLIPSLLLDCGLSCAESKVGMTPLSPSFPHSPQSTANFFALPNRQLRKSILLPSHPELYSVHSTSRRYRRSRREGGDPVRYGLS